MLKIQNFYEEAMDLVKNRKGRSASEFNLCFKENLDAIKKSVEDGTNMPELFKVFEKNGVKMPTLATLRLTFKKHFGCNPSQLRKKAREAARKRLGLLPIPEMKIEKTVPEPEVKEETAPEVAAKA